MLKNLRTDIDNRVIEKLAALEKEAWNYKFGPDSFERSSRLLAGGRKSSVAKAFENVLVRPEVSNHINAGSSEELRALGDRMNNIITRISQRPGHDPQFTNELQGIADMMGIKAGGRENLLNITSGKRLARALRQPKNMVDKAEGLVLAASPWVAGKLNRLNELNELYNLDNIAHSVKSLFM